jgi:ABC-type lipoprotein release transport system permease subunit
VAVSIEPFQVGRSRLRRMGFAMGIQSYFCCLTASLLPTAGLLLGILASRVLASIVYLATPRDPLVLAGVVVAMSLLGLLATWIPARRALSVDPMILLARGVNECPPR